MSQQLINLSPDLKQLRDEGYELEIKGGYLLIHQIPFVNQKTEIKRGTLVSALDLANNHKTTRPRSHVVYFSGDYPCNKDGSPIEGIRHSSPNKDIASGVRVNHMFSNKPSGGYKDYHEKICRYTEIISAPAKSINQNLTAKTFKVIINDSTDSQFQYIDTHSSRANIEHINSKLKNQKIAIIGLGGTGAYILDLVAKNPVKEIHLFDGDDFLLHNAFRSPGAASISVLEKNQKKTDYYMDIYSNMHRFIHSHPYYLNSLNIDELAGFSFVFICIDKDSLKKNLLEFLLGSNISFVDVGLGVNIVNEELIGTIRVTTGSGSKNDHLLKRISCGDDVANEYSTNIQIAELNALNATLAVLKWKKMCGIYQDLKKEHNTTYSINVSQLTNDDFET